MANKMLQESLDRQTKLKYFQIYCSQHFYIKYLLLIYSFKYFFKVSINLQNHFQKLMDPRSQTTREISQIQRVQLHQEDILLKNGEQKASKFTCKNLIITTIVTILFIVTICLSIYLYKAIQQRNNLIQKTSNLEETINYQTLTYKQQLQSQKQKFDAILQIAIDQQNKQIKKIQQQYANTFYQQNYQAKTLKSYEGLKPQQPIYMPEMEELIELQAKKDLIVVTHAGRMIYLEILYKHLLKQKENFLEWHLWLNTEVYQDIKYMEKLQKQNDWIKIVRLNPSVKDKSTAMVHFYKQDCQNNKVYLKLDDDILWLEENFVQKMFDSRFRLRTNFIAFANIINSAVHTHIQQRLGVFKYPQSIQYDCLGNGWSKPQIGAALHQQFIQSVLHNQTDKWRSFSEWQALDYQRISINAFLYYSQTIRSLDYIDKGGDEILYSILFPSMHKKPTIIMGDAVCVHGAFYTQRQYFNQNHPQILAKYQQFADKL